MLFIINGSCAPLMPSVMFFSSLAFEIGMKQKLFITICLIMSPFALFAQTNSDTTKAEQVQTFNHPQTPKPPYSYSSQDLTFTSSDGNIIYGATFTKPFKQRKYPTIILITGSGKQDRDESWFGHKPFLVIADYLAKKGYAVLRIDDRSTGKTTGDFNNSTTLDFAWDVEQAINYLKTRPDVAAKKIGLVGHSEGGLIAPIVASKRRDVAFIILLAGTGVNGAKIVA